MGEETKGDLTTCVVGKKREELRGRGVKCMNFLHTSQPKIIPLEDICCPLPLMQHHSCSGEV